MNRGARRGSEVAKEHQRLQVVSEATEGVREAAVVGVALQGIANFEDAVVVAVHTVIGKGIVKPLADFVRESGNVLREGAR